MLHSRSLTDRARPFDPTQAACCFASPCRSLVDCARVRSDEGHSVTGRSTTLALCSFSTLLLRLNQSTSPSGQALCCYTCGDVHEKRREKLKEDVKHLIKEKSFADQLKLFDSLQKLGVAYHFEEEIKYLLNLMKVSEEKLRMEFTEDVHVMALYFRLSREHGFEVSKDLLVKSYRDEKGCFKPCVFHDIKGPLSLYEASFLSMDGEDEIDEAKEFAVKHLNDCMRSNSSTNRVLAKHISLALELPLHHRIQKL
ncbi:hypothetical protein IEQ34_003016 [Dendrobium chrysotoxum]|uniref:Terpene synthase N-terminal domain-containing protein n=1 Tax=Dendrobium chrysotoxum TaxID=161865 RepID=A0AAV7HIT3_DENCH|nr:hypothetical protein IEQ34_003016 [Dendrobium chrysotoxum]